MYLIHLWLVTVIKYTIKNARHESVLSKFRFHRKSLNEQSLDSNFDSIYNDIIMLDKFLFCLSYFVKRQYNSIK